MRTIAIVQARMGSTRLPGKVLRDLCGATMLAQCVSRLQRARSLDEVVIATSYGPEDDAVVDEGHRIGVRVHRGSAHDVLARYHGAARITDADAIVRVTSDCPLIDPEVVDRVVAELSPTID